MQILLASLTAVFGAVIGSYLAVLVSRFGHQSSANQGRSVCDHCGKRLAAKDLIPLWSFLVLGGRCRYCAKPINRALFFIELVSGLGTMAIVLVNNANPWLAIAYLLSFWIGIVIFLIDLRDYIIPDRAVLGLLGSGFLLILVEPQRFSSSLIGLIVGVGVLGSLVLLTRGKGMGLGDVKLAAPLGLLLGWPLILVGLLAAFILGSLVGVMLLIRRSRGWRDAIPFGPFLLVGAALGMMWGTKVLEWYLGIARF